MPVTPTPSIAVRAIIQGYIPGQRRIFILWTARNTTKLACTAIGNSLPFNNTTGFYVNRMIFGRGATFLFTATGPGGSSQAVISVSPQNF